MVIFLMAKQVIIWGRPKNRKTCGIAINKKSIGTIWVNGIPHTYNANLVYSNKVTTEQIVEDDQKNKTKKRIILIRRK